MCRYRFDVDATADPSAAPTGSDPPTHAVSARSASVRTSGLSIALIAASAIGITLLDLDGPQLAPFRVDWWVIAVLAFTAEYLQFELEFRRGKCSITFSEIPLIIGLFLASPLALIAGRVIGALAYLALRERQSVKKALLNGAVFLAEPVVVLVVYHLVTGGLTLDHPTAWGVALLAVMAADLGSTLTIATVVRWHSGTTPMRRMLFFTVLTSPTNTSFALVIAIMLVYQPWATLLLTGTAIILLVTYRAYSAMSQRYQSLSLLYDFTQLVSGVRNPDAVLEAMLGHAKNLLNAERAEIWLNDVDGAEMRIVVDDDGWHAQALSHDHARLVPTWFSGDHDAIAVPRTGRSDLQARLAAALDATDAIVAPITESGRVIGMVAVVDRIGDMATFGAQDGRMFGTLADHASVALENGRLIMRLHDQARQREHEALHDALTGLPNRVLFGAQLRESVGMIAARGTAPAVAIMDLDGFKEINDTLGHQSGDLVLVEIARRIAAVVDPAVLVARLGGDEFAFLMASAADTAAVEQQARSIIDAVGQPLQVDGLSINMGISVGIAMAPRDGDDAATLMQRADVAMYVAKSQADSVSFYVADHDANTPRRLTLAHDLRHAIDAGQLHLVFQPKARLDDGVIIGAEALARWIHPTLGPVSPDEFIPLAERTGIMAELTAWAIESALTQVRVWQQLDLDWGVAVNLSMRNLIDTELVPTVARLLEASGVPHDKLTLEITETNVMTDPARTIDILNTFGEMGIHLSVDDFGTGYSSLSYLQRLPIDEVKIDKFFVLAMSTDANADAIVRSILDLARNLQLQVVAEGVEDSVTWEQLKALGCTIAQGYFLAKPMTADDILHWARREKAARQSAPLTLVRAAS